MKTLIINCSKKSFVEETGKVLSEFLGNEVAVSGIGKINNIKIESFDRIVFGLSLNPGQPEKILLQFLNVNSGFLKTKELGIFGCSSGKKEEDWKQVVAVFSEELLSHAKSVAVFSNEYQTEKMNFIRKLLAKRGFKISRQTIKIDYEGIRKFSRKMDRSFNPFLFIV